MASKPFFQIRAQAFHGLHCLHVCCDCGGIEEEKKENEYKIKHKVAAGGLFGAIETHPRSVESSQVNDSILHMNWKRKG